MNKFDAAKNLTQKAAERMYHKTLPEWLMSLTKLIEEREKACSLASADLATQSGTKAMPTSSSSKALAQPADLHKKESPLRRSCSSAAGERAAQGPTTPISEVFSEKDKMIVDKRTGKYFQMLVYAFNAHNYTARG